MAKIAVTGGRGLIGSATIAYAIAQGHDAWAFDRSQGEDILGDLGALHGADVVIHLAGVLGTSELFETPEEAVHVNIIGTLRILQWCRENGAGFVDITMPDSSWANVYQATKLCAMRLAKAWQRNFDVPVSHVRAFNAFGPGQKHGEGHPQKIVPTFAWHAWRGLPIPIWGNGSQTVDLVHTDDIARMLVDATAHGDNQIFDAGTGTEIDVLSLAMKINEWCGQDTDNIDFLPMRLGEEEDTRIKAQGDGWDLLGWQPKLDWGQLHETVEWYRPRD